MKKRAMLTRRNKKKKNVLADLPALRAGLFGELNELKHLKIEWKQGAAPTLTILDESGKEVRQVVIEKDLNVSEFLQLLGENKVNLERQTLVGTTDEPIARFEYNKTEFLLFGNDVLRSVMLAKAEALGGRPLMMLRKEKQTAIAEWLNAFPGKTFHTSGYRDDGLYFWSYSELLPSRDRGRFPWAKKEPSDGDCVVMREGLLYASPCNAFGHAIVERDLVSSSPSKEQPRSEL